MIEVVRGSLVQQRVDATVNAANTFMRRGGGIDGVIHRSASTGTYRFPLPLAAEIAVSTVSETLLQRKWLRRVVFAMFGKDEFEAFTAELQQVVKP